MVLMIKCIVISLLIVCFMCFILGDQFEKMTHGFDGGEKFLVSIVFFIALSISIAGIGSYQ